MSILDSIVSAVASYNERRARALVRAELLALSDCRLQDLGFDRAELCKGLDAWPWRSEVCEFVKPETESQPVMTRKELRKAERELHAMSDRELGELGIARFDIRRAVNGDLSRVA